MIESIVFVHGTGVRSWSYKVSASKVLAALREHGFEGHFEPCLWGDKHGARLWHDGRSIPDFSGAQPAKPDDEAFRALGSLLAVDPLYELRELTGVAQIGARVAPKDRQQLDDFPAALQSAVKGKKVVQALQGIAQAADLQSAADAVAASEPLKQALDSASTLETALQQAAARAVVSVLQMQRSDDERLEAGEDGDPAPLPSEQRERLVTAIVDELGGVEMGRASDWVKKRLIGFGNRWVHGIVQRRRDVVYNGAYALAGDILLYQKDGSAIREEIAKHIDVCKGDVAVIAHSLGGIATVDLLIERAIPRVKLLATVGSQAPLLYEIGALRTLGPKDKLPASFPPTWINFYNVNDLLSYRAATVFDLPFKKMVLRDVPIVSDHPFPMSHSAYWESKVLWTELQKHL